MKRWTIATIIGLVVALGVVAGLYELTNSRTFQLTGDLVHRVETTAKVVALTFDDGPGDYAPDVLKTLADKDVRATFYLNGRDLAARPELGAAIAAGGHEIGNHTYSHRRMVLVTPGTVAEEIERTDTEIRRTGYQGPITFRPPNGKKLWTLPKYLADHDRTTITWDVEPDSGEHTAEQMVTTTLHQVRPGSIILLHTMFAARAQSRAAIAPIIDGLRRDGYRFVTVAELLALRGR